MPPGHNKEFGKTHLITGRWINYNCTAKQVPRGIIRAKKQNKRDLESGRNTVKVEREPEK